MVDNNENIGTEKTDDAQTVAGGQTRLAKAIDEARKNAQTFSEDLQQRGEGYREKLNTTAQEWTETAKSAGEQSKERATEYANIGKQKTSEAISGLSSVVSENAAYLDEKFGEKYGDYARSAATSMKSTADSLNEKDLGALTEDAKELVRKSPGIAVAIAAATGFAIAQLFSGKKD